MQFIYVLLIVFYLYSVNAEQVHEVDGFKYLFSDHFKSTWFGANQYCHYRGMILIDIPTEHEQVRILNLIAKLKPPYNQTYYWTSGTDLAKEGNFFWMSSGHSFLYTNWNINVSPSNAYHPEHQETENCVELRHENGYKWNDHACHQEMSFICRNKVISTLIKHPEHNECRRG